MEDIYKSIEKMIIEKLGIPEKEISNESSFKKDFNIDSLDLFEFFQDTEKRFDIIIPDEEAEKIDKVGKLITFIKGQKK